MADPAEPNSSDQLRLTRWLAGLFFFALLMGPGPGIYLINDYAAAGGKILGLPALYTWAVFWCAVEAFIVVVAYLKLWRGKA